MPLVNLVIVSDRVEKEKEEKFKAILADHAVVLQEFWHLRWMKGWGRRIKELWSLAKFCTRDNSFFHNRNNI